MKTIFEKSTGVDGIGVNVADCKELSSYIPATLLRENPIGLPQLSELDFDTQQDYLT